MGKDARLVARADDDLVERLDTIADRYEMDHSKMVRLLVQDGLRRVERSGLDAVVSDDPNPIEEQPA